MAKKDLGYIKFNLSKAKKYIDDAEDIARKAGDKDGAEKVSEAGAGVEKVKRHFDKDL